MWIFGSKKKERKKERKNLDKVYTFAYAKTYICAKHIVLHMQKYMFCITYEKLYIE